MQSGDTTPNQPTAALVVVDDEPAVRRVLSMRLQLSGYGWCALKTVSKRALCERAAGFGGT